LPIADTLTLGTISIPMQVLDINVGFLYILAITSLSVYSLVLGGFGSNSKYPLFSAMRSSAQMISYEIAMGLSLVGLVMVFSTVHLGELTSAQGEVLLGFIPKWGVVVQPLGFILFCIAALAELNRVPFDLPEGESEIIGFHTEYSAMKYGLFFMAEYANIFVVGAIIATLFLGGWQIPWLPTGVLKSNAALALQGASVLAIIGSMIAAFRLHDFYKKRRYKWSDLRDLEGYFLYGALGVVVLFALGAIIAGQMVPFNGIVSSLVAMSLQIAIFVTKALIICFIIVWIRWSLPRLRYDQLMALGWKIMLPLGIANVLFTGIALLLLQ
jgi:NADH-quinone oxidoreductase subunit H